MATIKDVARASKVSIATVSRALNGSPLVSPTTRQRVEAAAQRLSYWPNGVARSLITSRTHTLGVLLPDLRGEFFSEIIRGINQASHTRGFHILVSRCSSSASELTSVLRSMRGRVDGLIVMSPDLDASTTLEQFASSVVTVMLNPEVTLRECDTISIANAEGASTIVRHLIWLGHRRIAIINGPDCNIDARQRLEGYRAALSEAGLEPSSDLERPGDFTEPSGYQAALELVRQASRPTAIFAANDNMAIGAMGALEDSRVRVPEDIAITGFDDIDMARYLTPPLTTMHVDMLHLGKRAVQLLFDRERSADGERRHEVLPATLVPRGTCGAHPSNAKHALRVRHQVAAASPQEGP